MEVSLLSSIIIGGAGVAITLLYSHYARQLERDRMMKDLFKEFNDSYKKLNDDLIRIASDYPTYEALDQAPNSLRLKDKLQDYFNLCAEEFYWYHHRKRIDPVVWRSWNKGMQNWFKVPSIREMWKREVEQNGKSSYYIVDENEFFTE